MLIVLAAGIVRIMEAFQANGLGEGPLMFAIGLLTLLAHPLFTSGVLTIRPAAYFIFDGSGEIAAGTPLRPADVGG